VLSWKIIVKRDTPSIVTITNLTLAYDKLFALMFLRVVLTDIEISNWRNAQGFLVA
jgi:hypothetical protein